MDYNNNDGGELLSSGNLSIFYHLDWLLSKNVVSIRYLTDIKFRQAYNYVIFNCDKMRHFIKLTL
jgi:hypothetical protein